jgi:SH3-like domain-containing protein
MTIPGFGAAAIGCLIAVLSYAAPAGAVEDTQQEIVETVASETGPVTHLPIPRFVSMRAEESNVRRGPSLTHRIDWVYKRKDMPLEITAEYGHWRRVRDQEGMGGWVHYSLLSGTRTVLVQADGVELRMRPDDKAAVVAQLEHGVVARLGDCLANWCRLSVAGYRGWTHKTGLWGVGPAELRD